MALTHQAEIQIGRIYSPLTISPGITVQGNVPDVQQYDIATNLYTPDYTNTNLVLVPAMDVADPDGVIPTGPVALTNIKWTLIENGVETLISASTSGFSIDTDGKLTVKRNCQGQNPMTFRFEGEYQDPRTGEIHRMVETHMVDCEAVSVLPKLSLDTSGLIAYDPIRDGKVVRKVKASLTIGGQEVAVANREFVWQKRDCDIDNQWADIDGTDILDYDVDVNADGSELTIKPWLIGYRIDIRVYAKYSPYGNPSSLPIDNRTPVETFSVKRVVGKLWGIVGKCPKNIKAGTKNLYPELIVKDSKGIIPNPDEVLEIQWRTSTGNANGTVTKSAVIARGAKPIIPTSFVGTTRGGKPIAEFGAKDPKGGITSGEFLLTFNGEILIV